MKSHEETEAPGGNMVVAATTARGGLCPC